MYPGIHVPQFGTLGLGQVIQQQQNWLDDQTIIWKGYSRLD